MRGPFILTLLIVVLLPIEYCWAGKLSSARGAARSSEPSSKPEKAESQDNNSGKLSRARNEVRQGRPQNDHGPDRGRDRNRWGRRGSQGGNHHNHRDSWFHFSWFDSDPYCAPPVVEQRIYHTYPNEQTYTVPAAPRCADPVQSSLAASFPNRFTPYPYAEGCDGRLFTTSNVCGHQWLGRVQYEYGSDSDDLDRNGIGFLLEHAGGFGIDFDWDSYTETLPGGGHDELHIGEFDFLYRVAQSDHLLMRAGVGVSWLGDSIGSEAGVNFTIKADYMPSRPFVFSGELDFGTLGDAENFHAAGSVGAMLGRAEIYGGYDYRRIGDVEIEGPQIGIRFWF